MQRSAAETTSRGKGNPTSAAKASALSALLAAVIALLESDEDALALLAEADPLVLAKLRGMEAQRDLLNAEGGCLTVAEVASVLGISRQAVDKRRGTGGLLALSATRRGYLYPAWQFAQGDVLPGFKAVSAALAEADPWSRVRFFVSPNTALDGRKPIVALQRGGVDEVVRAAELWGQQGAA